MSLAAAKHMLVFDTETRTDTAQALTSAVTVSTKTAGAGGRLILRRRPVTRRSAHVGTICRDACGRHRSAPRRRAAAAAEPPRVPRKAVRRGVRQPRPGGGVQSSLRPFAAGRERQQHARSSLCGRFLVRAVGLRKTGQSPVNKYRPRVAIKHIDSKRALKGLPERGTPIQWI